MAFKLSERSLGKLVGVKEDLGNVVKIAITRTPIDFGVIEGVRSIETQKEYVEKGVSQTMDSKHLTGEAVDLLAYLGDRGSWELPLYYKIADTIKECATELGVSVRWGAAWHIPDITKYPGSMEEASKEYIALRESQGRKPFIDAPHFEYVKEIENNEPAARGESGQRTGSNGRKWYSILCSLVSRK